ncbi:MAG: glycosyltransferase [Candidatus Amulumruptor caecigallinarius]|nr:glycosyltransferase [Candidatus Amulumruptor caecigallinarius]MCM1397750.1 glycosyltransferase [Candidatus Amulumruptor caecigallinarius]MCM1454789.1 glycosyltransferase [bacterium]
MARIFSVITVTRNAAATLPATIASILAQRGELLEWVVVDGGSTDGTLRMVEEAGVEELRLLSEPDKGIYDAMNKGLAMATGDYVVFLNAGDSFHSADTLELLAEAALDNDYPGVMYGQTQIVDAARHPLGMRHLRAPEELTVDSFKEGMVVCHQAFVVLRKLTTFFNTAYRLSADYEWCICCTQRSRRNKYVDAILVDYLAEGMTTANMRESLRERFSIMCRYFGTLPTVIRHLKFLRRYIGRSGKPTMQNTDTQ